MEEYFVWEKMWLKCYRELTSEWPLIDPDLIFQFLAFFTYNRYYKFWSPCIFLCFFNGEGFRATQEKFSKFG